MSRPALSRSASARFAAAIALLLSVVSLSLPLSADLSSAANAPSYSAASIVQGASQVSGVLAPNSIVTIYGSGLAFDTYSVATGDLEGGNLPLTLGGVMVYANGMSCGLFFVSPTQVNFVIPYIIVDTQITISLARQSLRGPQIRMPAALAAPGIFQWNGNFAVAQHADGSLISPTSPAHAGEVVVIYATGLGRTSPDILSGNISNLALGIRYASQFQVLFDGIACDPSNVLYAGITPGYAGLYQVNVRLPSGVGPNPAVQLVLAGQSSPAPVRLYVN